MDVTRQHTSIQFLLLLMAVLQLWRSQPTYEANTKEAEAGKSQRNGTSTLFKLYLKASLSTTTPLIF